MRILFTFIFLFSFARIFPQVTTFKVKNDTSSENVAVTPVVENKSEIFTVVEEMPQFPDGTKSMYQFIAQNITYPQKEKEERIQGKVYLKFIIEPDGSIGTIDIIKGIPNGKALEEEAIHVVKIMPKWVPGKQNGKPVRVYYNLPISFILK
ncbi:MAG TPA: energy transducer TonB [Bacteroidia bacterium]|jgi:protein TonB|nr:energy transducer TonB [Bacteroidia bacterium]